jgi:uroporphyrinogen-III decarboxylase
MNEQQWDTILDVIQGKRMSTLPTGFIIDCPWLPGWYGVNMLDYFTSDDCWFEANKKAIETFPETIFLPGFWSEYGMCTEPSAFGAKCRWHTTNMPHAEKVLTDLADVDSLSKPEVRTDGFLPFVINRLRNTRPQIEALGHQIKFAVARGPLNIASFLHGTTELMMAMMTDPDRCHKLIHIITDFLIDWIGYQKEQFPSIEGIMLLDDIIGFVGDQQCRDYVVPYFTKIYRTFDAPVKFLHNDANGLVSAPYLTKMGVNLINYSFEHSIRELREKSHNQVGILGNIPPRDVLAAGTPHDVQEAVKQSVAGLDDWGRLILSCGGGMPPDVPTENIQAFINAAQTLGPADQE